MNMRDRAQWRAPRGRDTKQEEQPAMDKITEWKPEQNVLVRSVIGKMQEEHGELGAIMGRIMCQGIDGRMPTRDEDQRYNGEPNVRCLEEEMADMIATINHAINKLNLDREFIKERANRKQRGFERWHSMPSFAGITWSPNPNG